MNTMDIEDAMKIDPIKESLIQLMIISFGLFLLFSTCACFCWIGMYLFSPPRDSILIVGLPNSGKTLMFYHLTYARNRPTFTPNEEKIGAYKTMTGRKIWRIVDIPDKEGLRYTYFNKYKIYANAIVFVIDSSTIVADVKQVAEYLYMVLLEIAVQEYPISLLILCNKQDHQNAKSVELIMRLLQSELHLVRIIKVKQVRGAPTKVTVYLGKQYDGYRFTDLICKINILECSSATGGYGNPANLMPLKMWLDKR